MRKSILLLCLLVSSALYAQPTPIVLDYDDGKEAKYPKLGKLESNTLEKMGLEYFTPKNTVFFGGANFINGTLLYDAFMSMGMGHSFEKDEFLFFFFTSLKTKEFVADMERIFKKKQPSINDFHRYQIRAQLADFYRLYNLPKEEGDKKVSELWNENVRYATSDEAKRIANADTLIYVSLPELKGKEMYREKYNNVEMVYIQKEDRGFAFYILLFTDRAKKDLEYYKKKTLSTLRYK